jgi:hypothetical protein
MGTDEKYLEKYLRKSDYIGIGAVAKASQAQRMHGLSRLWKQYLIDKVTQKPIVKTHAMGLTAVDSLVRFPWYSVDSITPSLAAGYGGVFLPAVRKKKFDHLDIDPYKVSDQFHHEPNNVRSFINLPETLKKMYLASFEEQGFKLGKITNVKARLKSKKDKIEKDPPRLVELDLTEPDDSNTTLASSNRERRRWNFYAWDRLSKSLPDWDAPYSEGDRIEHTVTASGNGPIVYIGGTFDSLKSLIACKTELGFLFSFATVTKNFIPTLTEILENENKPRRIKRRPRNSKAGVSK